VLPVLQFLYFEIPHGADFKDPYVFSRLWSPYKPSGKLRRNPPIKCSRARRRPNDPIQPLRFRTCCPRLKASFAGFIDDDAMLKPISKETSLYPNTLTSERLRGLQNVADRYINHWLCFGAGFRTVSGIVLFNGDRFRRWSHRLQIRL